MTTVNLHKDRIITHGDSTRYSKNTSNSKKITFGSNNLDPTSAFREQQIQQEEQSKQHFLQMKSAQKNVVQYSNSSPKAAAPAHQANFLSNDFIKKQKQLMKKRNISTTSSLPLFKFNIIPGLLICLGCTLFNLIATYVISISQVNNFQASLTFLSKIFIISFLIFQVFYLSICFLETYRCY